jgi:hypothetical protein
MPSSHAKVIRSVVYTQTVEWRAKYMTETANLPAIPAQSPAPLSRDIIKEIAMDIGKEVAAHIETMYPQAVEATSKNMLLSVRNCIHNEIMAALETIDENEIRERLERRRQFRRQHRSAYRRIRKQEITQDVVNDV